MPTLTAPPAVAVDLQSCFHQVKASQQWFTSRIVPLTVDQLRWQPAPARWSIADCLEHLQLMLGLYLPKIEQASMLGWRQGRIASAPPCHPPAEFDALAAAEPPSVLRRVALPATRPTGYLILEDVIDGFEAWRNRYAAALRRADGLDLEGIAIDQPPHAQIQTLGGALAFLAVHERRHLWQADRVRRLPNFPQMTLYSTGEWAYGVFAGARQ